MPTDLSTFANIALSGSTYADWQRCKPLLKAVAQLSPAALRDHSRNFSQWPKEIPRDAPDGKHALEPPLKALLSRCNILHEIDETYTYPIYLEKITTHPDLADRSLPSGQAVRLARAFTGKLADRRIGQTGQADLVGGLSVVVGGVRIERTLEIEVKMPWGKQSKEQEQRMNALRARGGIYLLVRSVAETVEGLRAELRNQS
jgi:hypothetical protein